MKRYTKKEVQEKINKIHGKEKFLLLGEYKNARTLIETKCLKCDHVWNANTHSLIRGHGCPKCANNIKRTQNQFEELVKEITNGEYKVIGKYINNNTPIIIKHLKCGNEFNMSPKAFLNGQRCPKERYKRSGASNRIDLKEAKSRISNSTNGEFDIISDYKGIKQKAKIIHKECGNIFETVPDSIISGKSGCPICKKSHGEKHIKSFLEENNYNFKQEFRIKECKNIRPLPFDFAVFEENKILFLIEYDGEQHFKPKFGLKEFERTKQNDNIKNEFCKNNNIRLIRIPYKRTYNDKEMKKYIYNILFDKLIPSQA